MTNGDRLRRTLTDGFIVKNLSLEELNGIFGLDLDICEGCRFRGADADDCDEYGENTCDVIFAEWLKKER